MQFWNDNSWNAPMLKRFTAVSLDAGQLEVDVMEPSQREVGGPSPASLWLVEHSALPFLIGESIQGSANAEAVSALPTLPIPVSTRAHRVRF